MNAAKTTAARVAELRQRRDDLGLKRLELYAHPDDHEAIKALAAKLQRKRERTVVHLFPKREDTMAEKTGISWTDSTFNPWIGCTKVGPGCDLCYAEALMDKRWHRVQWGSGANWKQPLLWEKEHEAFMLAHGRRRRVFCASLADVFDNEAPPQWRGELWALVKATPHLDWLILTKRIGNVAGMAPAEGLPSNVWLGATMVNQPEWDRDARKLLAVDASVRYAITWR